MKKLLTIALVCLAVMTAGAQTKVTKAVRNTKATTEKVAKCPRNQADCCAAKADCTKANCAKANCAQNNCTKANCTQNNCTKANCTQANCAQNNCAKVNCTKSNCAQNNCPKTECRHAKANCCRAKNECTVLKKAPAKKK